MPPAQKWQGGSVEKQGPRIDRLSVQVRNNSLLIRKAAALL
ncbi:MAG: hypothetical protein WCF23_08935 [Candidatus Nitrosopolaris sp.]